MITINPNAPALLPLPLPVLAEADEEGSE